jgi:FemAB family protein
LLLETEDIKQLALSKGLSVSLRSEIPNIWAEVLDRTAYVPVMYTSSSIEFQWAYQRGHGGIWQDISIIIYWNSSPVAVWPLSLAIKDGKTFLNSHGLPVHPPLFVADCPELSRKRITKICIDIADTIAMKSGANIWESTEAFNDSNGFSDWHIESMSRGATCTVKHDLFINLQQNMEVIKRGFRKSYKSLVTSGMRNWTVGVLDAADEMIWNQFSKLHFKVSGRKTRSDETWEIHLKDIKRQQGFLVYLLNSAGEMDGGGFFNFTQDEGMYSVAAYNRALFDKPLGHIVQYRAIEELKNRGVRWYKIGARPYRLELPSPSDKEISIGEFKQGFASHMFPRFGLLHPVSEASIYQAQERLV